MTDSGRLHLIPVSLGPAPLARWLPDDVHSIAAGLTHYIAENAKTARAFLKQIGTTHALQTITIHTLTEQASEQDIEAWLSPIQDGVDIGLVSEAGCPAVADPGARVARIAHRLGITVAPHVGPSSLLLGLMASGLQGQHFAFHGYAPVKPDERQKQLQAWEQMSARQNQTQMLIETPYRNDAMFDTLLGALRGNTDLCIARALTTDEEWIRTATVSQWRSLPRPVLQRMPVLFLFLAR